MKNHIHVIAVFLNSFHVIPSQHRQGTLQWFSTKAYNHENQLTKPSMKAKRINETQKRRVNLNFTRLLCLVKFHKATLFGFKYIKKKENGTPKKL